MAMSDEWDDTEGLQDDWPEQPSTYEFKLPDPLADTPAALESLVGEGSPRPEQPDTATVPSPPAAGRVCRAPGCTTSLEGKHGATRYCEEHKPGSHHSGMTGAAGEAVTERATKQTGSSKLSRKEELERCEANAKFLIEMCAAGVLALGGESPKLREDAIDIKSNAGKVAPSIKNVAEYEDWLRKLLSGGQQNARVLAWVGLVLTAGAVAVPILLRHEMIPANIAGLAAAAAMGGEVASAAAA